MLLGEAGAASEEATTATTTPQCHHLLQHASRARVPQLLTLSNDLFDVCLSCLMKIFRFANEGRTVDT